MIKLALALALVAACGANPAEVKTAKEARYHADGKVIFDAALAVTKEKYRIGEVDQVGLRFATAPQWYEPEGGRESAGTGNYVQAVPGSLAVSLVVAVVDADTGFVVTVTPHTLQILAGSPQPRELAPDDPALPGWVHGRVDALALAIYERAKPYALAPPQGK